MLHFIIIALFAVVVMHDPEVTGGHGGVVPPHPHAPGWVWAASLGSMFLLGLGTVVVIGWLARRVERYGSIAAAEGADRVLGVSRWAMLAVHASNVLWLGWLGAVRGVLGDTIVLDELVAVLPALLVLVAGWWAYYPIDLAYKNATMFRMMETGKALYPPVSRWRYVVLNVRHQVLLTLVPLMMIGAWHEGMTRVMERVAAQPGAAGEWLSIEQNRTMVDGVLQLVGVAGVFTLSPLVLRRVWDTVRLGPGPLHDRLMALCKASRVKVRGLLVWRTHGTLLNGAVIGLFGPLRYILLTDALLDQLPEEQLEAVMAHEVGHARHGHMPWLVAGMMAGLGIALAVVWVAATGVLIGLDATGHPHLSEAIANSDGLKGAMLACSFLGGAMWFGFVSRRFEWQADAFAVQQLSRVMPAEEPTLWDAAGVQAEGAVKRSEAVQAAAVRAMAGALDSVAQLNHLSVNSFSWRHGSIAYRQRRLAALAGQPLERLKIDRTSRWLKRGIAAAIVLMIAAAALDYFTGPTIDDDLMQSAPVRNWEPYK